MTVSKQFWLYDQDVFYFERINNLLSIFILQKIDQKDRLRELIWHKLPDQFPLESSHCFIRSYDGQSFTLLIIAIQSYLQEYFIEWKK